MSLPSGTSPSGAARTPSFHRLAFWPAVVLALIPLVTPSVAVADLAGDIQRAIRSAELRKAKISISVRDADSNAPLIAIDESRPMIPASNNKLLTTGAFLHAFGADFAFRTRMVKAGEDLVVVGDGDPAFGDPDLMPEMSYTQSDGEQKRGLDIETLLAIWVDAVKAEQFTVIDELIIDARVFDTIGYHPRWPKDQYKEDYCAEVWGLNFHHNVLHVWPRPRAGGPADVSRIAPAARGIVRSNETQSRTGTQDRHTFWINRPPDRNAFTFNGNVKIPASDPTPVTLHNVPVFFADLFLDRLRAAGVTVRAARVAAPIDPRFSDGTPIGPEVRTPIVTVLYRCNTDSDNLYAESLLKRLGRAATKSPGSWANGAAALRHAVAERLDNPALAAAIAPDDGSGLSRENRVTAAALTAWLSTFHKDPVLGPAFIESLAVGGRTGTVRKRFQDIARTGCTVQCKTGYIRGVSCLSGFVTAPDGRRLSFSVLCNELVEPNAVAKAKLLQERVVTALADELTATAARDRLGGG
ncbi:MAG: D-alanyl-D-alanine carboxypeptidase/D-alanyl-D-alanine-endopeptidase [Phycisphaerae bacterium]|nr:D-alanyl-D-alanine carboxypeptidase/D-alanyl-D-alanine-endopeptidase [Phycisphaerae bacterium]